MHGPKNLSKYKLSAIKTLKNCTDIIMINESKGEAVTILNLNHANKQLDDLLHYKQFIYDLLYI